MRLNKPTYKLLLLFLLVWIPVLIQAQVQYNELTDSLRASIRLKSHIAIHSEDFNHPAIKQILGSKIPVAVIADKQFTDIQIRLLEKFKSRQDFIPIITNDSVNQVDKSLMVVIRLNWVDHFNIKDSTRTDSLDYNLFSNNELLQLTIEADSFPSDTLITQLWENTGKLPNFIECNLNKIQKSLNLIRQLNTRQKFFGVVQTENKLLANVSWKEFPIRKTNGYYCFPMTQSLSPYKAGYQFSPDIIINSGSNRNKAKEFKALRLDADFRLNDHFIFDKKIENLHRENEDEILNNQVEFVKDNTRGHVAHFSGQAFIDGGIQSQEILKSNFSITAWIKPTQLDLNNSVLGKGKNFVLKVHDGILTFTMQGKKDYYAHHAKIPVNEWSFISLVHSAFENQIRFYVNGEFVHQFQLISPYEGSDNTLLIGNNLFEEFFVGYIGEIKIWERELNHDEISDQYQISADYSDSKSLMRKLGVIGILILLSVISFIISKKIKRNKSANPKKQKTISKKHRKPTKEQIYCFGGLQVISREGVNVAQKFSPKLKQLFVLIFINSINGKKGISSTKLSGYLWPGADPKNVKNTRGTNIQKLKAALEPCSNIKLIFKDKLWLIEMDEACYSDYADALIKLETIKETAAEDQANDELTELISILKKGTLFPNMTESWIDPYISSISDLIIELGLSLFQDLDAKKYASLLYEVAEVVSINDPLNEPALEKKLALLTQQGKLGLARSIYDNFVKLYFELYQENYSVDFKSITNSNSEKK